ncbi:MAG: maltose ABC transporter substrate-binding protein [Clostridia bacterium]|nr:maltose ABC transporter substrate-binding protein [Clostridia bacterium]
MKRRSILALVLAIVMVASLATACGQAKPATTDSATPTTSESASPSESASATPAAPVALKVWESDGPEKLFVEEMVKQYTTQFPNVTITVEPVAHTDAAQRMQLDGPAGVGADVFAAPHDKLGEMLSGGLILENTNAAELKASFVEAAIKATSAEGKSYGYPTGIETYALFYNKALVQTPPQTWDEVKAFCKTFNKPADGQFGIAWDVGNAYFSYMFLSGYGADLFGPDGTDKAKHMVNSPEAVKSLQYYQTFKKECLDVAAADSNGAFMDAGFTNGKIAMAITGPWSIKTYRDAKIDFGVTTLPKLPGSDTPPKSFSGIRAMYVSSFTKVADEAQKFANFLVSKDSLTKRYEMTGQIPPRTDIKISDDAHAGILAQFAFSKPMPSIPAMGQYWPAMGAAYANIWNGNDIKTELDAAAAAIEAAQ